jgi:hypothetical protein
MAGVKNNARIIVVEIVIVISLLACAACAAWYLLWDSCDPLEKQAKNDIKSIELVVAAYYAWSGFYPNTLQELTYAFDKSHPWISEEELIDPWGQPYGYDASSRPGNWGKPPLVYTLGPPGQGKPIRNWD